MKAATILVPGGYATIQAAIDASRDGDTVIVADGTYVENIHFPVATSNRNITLISENGPEFTIIDGNSGIVVLFPAESDSILEGFTITNGRTRSYGGGILIGRDASPTITNCIITNNLASAGGGIACGESSAPLITNSIIEYNFATVTGHNNGGGIHIGENSTPTIINCTFKDNYSSKMGGTIAMNIAAPLFVNCTFDNNMAGIAGGAMALTDSAPIITNCTFSNNTSKMNPGGAIACNYLEDLTNYSLPEGKVTNSIFWGDHPAEIACEAIRMSVTYSDIQGGPNWPVNPDFRRADIWPGTGNINADPRFRDQANGDFHLTSKSPCIDAGNNSYPDLQTTDINGDVRKINDPDVADTGNGTQPIVDMGAFEKSPGYVQSPPTIVSGNEWTPDPTRQEHRGGGVLEDGLYGDGFYVDGVRVGQQAGGPLGLGGPQDAALGGEDIDGPPGGILGDILKSSVIGYHLDGMTAQGIEIYMPVTKEFKALKGAQEYVRSFAPDLARIVRECFDFLERKADTDKEGFLYSLGTNVFPALGKIAEESLELIGEEHFINEAYSNTTISVEEFNKFKKQGRAVAPKTVKNSIPAYFSMQELVLTSVLF